MEHIMVPIFRKSGLPLELEDIQRYRAEWRRLYDKVEKLCKKDMLRMQNKLAKIHDIMQKKYKIVGEVQLMDTTESYVRMIKKYGPIIVTTKADSDDLVYYIDDDDNVGR